MDVLPDRLQDAWKSETTTALAITAALSSKYGKPLPWKLVQGAFDGAFQAHYLERTVDSKPWPCDYGDAQWIKVRIPQGVTPPTSEEGHITNLPLGKRIAEANMQPNQLQDLAEIMGDLLNAAGGYDLKFLLRLEVDGKVPDDVIGRLNQILAKVNSSIKFIQGIDN